jgi:4-amino-4-deoxy-L-arabinose transferase-like glycosyltransferase
MYLQFASNLIHHGEYATRNGHVFERLVPVGGTGPTLIVPVALALWVGHNSLVAARLAIFVYFLIVLISIYLLARRIGGHEAGVISIPLFLTAGYTTYDTFWMSRQVLAEIPAFAFMLLGLWVWFKGWNGHAGWLIVSSILMGLAVITKNQFVWVLGPGLGLLIIIDLFYYKQLNWWERLAPLVGIIIGYVGWFLLSLWIVGSANSGSYLEVQGYVARVSFLRLSPQLWLTNLKFLYKSEQWLLALAAIVYGLFLSRKRTLQGLQSLTLPLFASMALLSFLGLSLPWARYLYPALVLAALCAALSITHLVRWISLRWNFGRLQKVALLALIVILLTAPRIVQNVQRITTTSNVNAARFAALVDQHVPATASILNWEWEIEFYSQHFFLHPPNRLFPALLDQLYNGRHSPILDEPRIPLEVDYLIVGPFATDTQVFASALAQRPHDLLVSEGPYQLYQFHK